MSEVKCDMCGCVFERADCLLRRTKHHFCSRKCLADFSNKAKNPDGYNSLKNYDNISRHMSDLNRKLNPGRMTDEVREKLRKAHLDSGEGKSYRKVYGKHEHRVVAETVLGRPLRPGEVVHHIDGDKRNNSPDNLYVFENQSQHAKWHQKYKGGDFDEVHST